MDEKNFQYIKASFYFGLVGLALVVFGVLFSGFIHKAEEKKKELRAANGVASEIEYYTYVQSKGSQQVDELYEAAGRLLLDSQQPNMPRTEEEIVRDLRKLFQQALSGTPTTPYITHRESWDFDRLLSSGLQDQLILFHMDVQKLVVLEEIQLDFVDRRLRPFLMRYMDSSFTGAYTTTSEKKTALAELSANSFASAAYALLADREFANLLVDLRFYNGRLMDPYRRMGNGIERMRLMLSEHYPEMEWRAYERH